MATQPATPAQIDAAIELLSSASLTLDQWAAMSDALYKAADRCADGFSRDHFVTEGLEEATDAVFVRIRNLRDDYLLRVAARADRDDAWLRRWLRGVVL